MNDKRLGRQTVALAHPPSVLSFSNIGGKFEGQGPLADFFDEISNDSFFGEKTWEKAESAMQKTVLQRALEKAELTPEDLDYILAGDLLNQCIGSSFGLRELGIPFVFSAPLVRSSYNAEQAYASLLNRQQHMPSEAAEPSGSEQP